MSTGKTLVKKIDMHIHASAINGKDFERPGGFPLATPEQIRKMYGELGVERGFLLPLSNPEGVYCLQTNEQIEEVAAANGDIFWWFCSIHPTFGANSPDADLSYFLNHYKERGAKGVGEMTFCLPFGDPRVQNLFRHCELCGMPALIHIAPSEYGSYGIIDSSGLPGLESTLKKFPKLKIIGHSQPFWAEISSGLLESERNIYPKGPVKEGTIARLLRSYENLFCDLSAGSGYNAMSRDPDYAFRFMEEFQDRLLFGTDICRDGQEVLLPQWLDNAYLSGGISETVYRKISRENAIKIFRLNV